jgi:hypothetical protein
LLILLHGKRTVRVGMILFLWMSEIDLKI